MAGPAPTEVLQYTEDQDKKLYKEVASSSTKAGHPVTAAEVNPEDHTQLNNIKEIFGDAAHVVGTAGTTLLGGEEPSTYVRTAHSSKGISLIKGRVKRLFTRSNR